MKILREVQSHLRVHGATICNVLLAYVWFMLARVVFFIVNHGYYSGITLKQLWSIFKGGLVFDTTAICYINVLYLLMMLVPLYSKEQRKYQLVAKWLFVVTNALALVMNLMDSVYFQFTNRRTTASVFSEFGNDGNVGGIIGYELVNHWYLTLTGVLMVWGMFKLYRSPAGKPARRSWIYYTSHTAILVAVAPFIVFGMRGGIGADVRPITISNANQYVDRPVEAALVLNTPFAVMRTIGKKPFVVPEYFSDEQQMEQLYTPVHQPTAAGKAAGKKLNVVVLIMESFGTEYIGAFNKELDGGTYKGYTPFLDSLITQSLVFEHSFANGRKSIDGMPSALSGIPMFVEPFFLTPSSMNKVSGIAGELSKVGYETAFFHGASRGSMGFEAFARATGFASYYGREDYGNDADFDGTWAIWDEEFFCYYADRMSEMKQPFATAIFSASSHHPFVVPARYKDKFPKGTQGIHQCVAYSDNALRHFFAKASRTDWFNNTLFVITADHTSQVEHNIYRSAAGTFAVPVIFYQPGSNLKGCRPGISQQIDIMPTVLNYLGYDKPYVAFGCDLLNTPAEETYAVNYYNGIYQYFQGNIMLQFDGEKSVALYDYVADPLLEHNMLSEQPQIVKKMETKLKAIVQQYMLRMTQDRLTAE